MDRILQEEYEKFWEGFLKDEFITYNSGKTNEELNLLSLIATMPPEEGEY